MRARGLAGCVAAAALAACGGLSTPDLATGVVAGRVEGARAGAYAYALGHPELRAALDAGGGFRLRVPVETAAVVVVDVGAEPLPPGEEGARAEAIPVVVRGADEVRLPDRHGERSARPEAEKLPLAGLLVVGARPEGWAAPSAPWFGVDGTDREGVAQDGVITFGRLPAGVHGVSATMVGFDAGWGAVEIHPGATVGYDLALPLAGRGPRGCAATGGCRGPMVCGEDGWCRLCVVEGGVSRGCGPGETCDGATGLCVAAPGAGGFCERCSADGDCASGACVRTGPGTAPGAGYCATACGGGGACPAGLRCEDGRCVAPQGCAAFLGAFCAGCVSEGAAACGGALAGGFCARWGTAAGHCTAPCAEDAQCGHLWPEGAWRCDAGIQGCVPVRRIY